MYQYLKKKYTQIIFIFLQIGIDLHRPLKFFAGIPKFFKDYLKIRKAYKGKIEFMPCLHDWYEEAGNTKGEYFIQDLNVARLIFERKPVLLADIGSSIDGFVSNVASFRDIDVIDVREVTSEIPGITFKQLDLALELNSKNEKIYDCITCLHAIEHFGLGRYGDSIDINGHKKGIKNISKMLKNNGYLYLSTPIGRERIEFNANRVFNPKTILTIGLENNLSLEKFYLIQDSKISLLELDDLLIKKLSNQEYALGIFLFKKV